MRMDFLVDKNRLFVARLRRARSVLSNVNVTLGHLSVRSPLQMKDKRLHHTCSMVKSNKRHSSSSSRQLPQPQRQFIYFHIIIIWFCASLCRTSADTDERKTLTSFVTHITHITHIRPQCNVLRAALLLLFVICFMTSCVAVKWNSISTKWIEMIVLRYTRVHIVSLQRTHLRAHEWQSSKHILLRWQCDEKIS